VAQRRVVVLAQLVRGHGKSSLVAEGVGASLRHVRRRARDAFATE
jgi:hypothetical protein